MIASLREWQDDASPLQLHPGDLGWFTRFGAEVTAAAIRVWSRRAEALAIGLLDSQDVLRLTVAPSAWDDEDLARAIVADVSDSGRGILPAGKVSVETPNGTAVQRLLSSDGWSDGESWTPLRRDLVGPVETDDLSVEVVGQETALEFAGVVNSAFGSTNYTVERWHAMAAGVAYTDARCLLVRDGQGVAVAVATVWGAGQGDQACSSRWASTPNTAGAVTVAASASRRQPSSGTWARRVPRFAPGARGQRPWLRTRPPASRDCLSDWTDQRAAESSMRSSACSRS